jgi:7,8-dihydropterin-6-yl-methyl-4-(beta-D-ribofuranosyl)aminobenzene 5'-phosphate synthase
MLAPVLAPWLAYKHAQFRKNQAKAQKLNQKIAETFKPLELPELEFVEITVLVEEKARSGFSTDPGVSYLIKTDLGSVLFDLGFGNTTKTLKANAKNLNADIGQVSGLVISHLHLDHMGGMAASKNRTIPLCQGLEALQGKPCFLPAQAKAPDYEPRLVEKPEMLAAGLGSTGPLARSLFFMGLCLEQGILAKIKGKGILLITGCGHPTVPLLLKTRAKLAPGPFYALAGGLHFPLTKSRLCKSGWQLQGLVGTGKPPWQRITEQDLDQAIVKVKEAGIKRLLLSAHDTCDHGLAMLARKSQAQSTVLKAGGVYRL